MTLAELSAVRRIAVGSIELRVVENIEELGAEINVLGFRERIVFSMAKSVC